jgi:hypothetical protein
MDCENNFFTLEFVHFNGNYQQRAEIKNILMSL